MEFCEKNHIITNEKKTKWMKMREELRENVDGKFIITERLENEQFNIKGQLIGKVEIQEA